MLVITIASDATAWYVIITTRRGNGTACIRDMARWPNVRAAKLHAEEIFGLLDWGKGGQPETQASVALDY
jgi:hypothetical protein